MDEKFAIYNTEFGYFKIGYLDNQIVFFKKIFDKNITDFGEKNSFTDHAFLQLREFFDGKRKSFDLPILLRGTEFQKKVWSALCDISYGELRSYKDIAIAVGNPKASRAIGMANNKNPITIIVPCHRVIGASGKLVGFAGGLDMKEKLLKLEGSIK